MARAPKSPTIAVFLHVPRTGGTTMRHIMEANLPLKHILPIYGKDIEVPEQVVQRLHQPTRDALKVVRGHIPYGIHQYLGWAQCYYFSLIRKPVERVWSLWNYAYRFKSHHLYEELRALGSIEAALEKQVSPEFNDGMSRQLSGLDGTFPQEPYVYGPVPYGEAMVCYEEVMVHIQERRILVGRTEDLDIFVSTFCDFMDFPNRGAAERVSNAGPPFTSQALSRGDLQAIAHYNEYDQMLWEFITEEWS